jgi:hypothetical protein
MKTALALVWLLSNGQLQGDPWIEFPNAEACRAARDEKAVAVVDRILFFSACMELGADLKATVIEFDLNDTWRKYHEELKDGQ